MKDVLQSKSRIPAFLKNKKDTIRPAIIVFCLPVLLYLQTLSFGFTRFDDTELISDNITFLSNFNNAPNAFLKDAFLTKNSQENSGNIFYRPLQTVSYMVDIGLSGGNNAWMYHLTNVLLLGLITGLLFLLLRKFLIPIKLAVIGTLLYCANPLFTSSITWIPARGDLLLMFFSLVSFWFLIEYLQKGKIEYLFLHWLSFTLALFCKETAVFLPILFITYYLVFSNKNRTDSKWGEKKHLLNILLYAISGILWFWLRSIATGNISNRSDVGLASFIQNMPTIPESLANFFLPFDIALIPTFSLLKTLTGIVLLILIIVLFFTNKERTKREKIFCLSWFLLLLLPTMLYKSEPYNYLNHRFFLPLVGILIFTLFSIPEKWLRKRISWWPIAIIIIVFSFFSFANARTYADPIAFYNAAIVQSQQNQMLYNNRGYVKLDAGNFREAITDFTKAIELKPAFALAYNNRGLAYSAANDFESAISDYDKAIELKPNFALAYLNRGNAFRSKGDLLRAVNDYDKAITLNPNDASGYNNRGNVYYNEGNFEMAIKCFNKAIELNPDDADAYCNRGIVLRDKGLLKEALQDFKKYEQLKKK